MINVNYAALKRVSGIAMSSTGAAAPPVNAIERRKHQTSVREMSSKYTSYDSAQVEVCDY